METLKEEGKQMTIKVRVRPRDEIEGEVNEFDTFVKAVAYVDWLGRFGGIEDGDTIVIEVNKEE